MDRTSCRDDVLEKGREEPPVTVMTSTQGISHTPVQRTHLSDAASRVRSCSESERRKAVVGEFCKFWITSFTSSVRATRREGCTSSTVRLHLLFLAHHSPL
jgi:hypothetical protein